LNRGGTEDTEITFITPEFIHASHEI
jgi:hypothetical protein